MCANCGKKTYVHSKPTASVFIVKEGKVLLAKRNIEPEKGAYDVIGGFLKNGEHPVVGAVREVFEETGLKIKLVDILGLYINDHYEYQGEIINNLDVFYVGQIIGGKIQLDEENKEAKWFPIKNPPRKIAFKTVVQGLKDLQKWYEKVYTTLQV